MKHMANNLNNPAVESYSPPPGILVSDHFVEPYGYSTFRSKGTRDWLLTYTLSGQGVYHLEGETVLCSTGDVVLLSPGTPHHYLTPEGQTWEFLWVHFVPEPRWSELLQLPERLPGLLFHHIEAKWLRQRLFEAFQRLIRDSKETDYWGRLLGINALEEVLVLLAQSAARRSVIDPRVEDTLHYLSSNLREQLTITSLAKRALLSPSRFAHLFKEQTGDSVMETLLKLRLRHAARLLEHTTLPVAEIAEEVGFRSPFYFTKQFHAMFGASPTKYRAGLTSVPRPE
jgi:AraC family transcriptional regulator, arabinose operon regulatory protein